MKNKLTLIIYIFLVSILGCKEQKSNFDKVTLKNTSDGMVWIPGGSFLCSASYCASYRISSRMGSTINSSLEHLGFRTVITTEMLLKK